MKVRLGPYGTTTPNDGGFFVGAIPAGTSSLSVQVETGNPGWVVRYPTGTVAVPRDTLFITDILVAPSVESSLARDHAAESARLRGMLRTAGVSEKLILAAIDRLRSDFSERTNVQAETLRAAERRGSERAEVYPRLSATIEAYTIKAGNVQIAFRYLLEPSFGSDSAFAQLKRAISEYNLAFESLKTQRNGFEKGVTDAWQSERLSADLRALLDYALGEIHSVQILPLNDVLPDVSRVLTRHYRGEEAVSKRAEVNARVKASVVALAVRLEELDRRKIRVMSDLQAL